VQAIHFLRMLLSTYINNLSVSPATGILKSYDTHASRGALDKNDGKKICSVVTTVRPNRVPNIQSNRQGTKSKLLQMTLESPTYHDGKSIT